MDSTGNRLFDSLSDDDLDRLVEIIVDQFGLTVDSGQFADRALSLIDDIAGLETITTKQASGFIAIMWRRYKSKSC